MTYAFICINAHEMLMPQVYYNNKVAMTKKGHVKKYTKIRIMTMMMSLECLQVAGKDNFLLSFFCHWTNKNNRAYSCFIYYEKRQFVQIMKKEKND